MGVFFASVRARRRAGLAFAVSVIPAVLAYFAAAYFWAHGNAAVLVLGLGAILLLAAALSLRGLLYVARVRIDLVDGYIVRQGFPFLRRSLSNDRVATIEEVTIDFGSGIMMLAWVLSDIRKRGLAWLMGDYWNRDQIGVLSAATGAKLERNGARVSYSDLAAVYGHSLQRW